MAHFPVSNSNLSAEHLAVFIQERYAIGDYTNCKLIRAGINDTYLVTSDDKYVFRVYSLNWRTVADIDEEIRLLNELKTQHVSVSYPIPDRKGNFIQKVNAPEGQRYAVLFSYAPGEKIHKYNEARHYQVGALMGRFHSITGDMKLNRCHYLPDQMLADGVRELTNFLSPDAEEMQFLLSTQQELLNALGDVDANALRSGVVHMDIWFDNLNVTEDNELTLFDFDFCGNGWLVLDIAYYILQLYNIEKYVLADIQPKVDSFLSGYQSVTKISNEELKLIPSLGVTLYYFYLGIQCKRYDNWSNVFLTEDYLKRFINGLVKRYYLLMNQSAV